MPDDIEHAEIMRKIGEEIDKIPPFMSTVRYHYCKLDLRPGGVFHYSP